MTKNRRFLCRTLLGQPIKTKDSLQLVSLQIQSYNKNRYVVNMLKHIHYKKRVSSINKPKHCKFSRQKYKYTTHTLLTSQKHN